MTANDSDVSDGEILTGSQVVRVYGENLTTPFVTLTFGGVEYTPLYQGEDYIEFILGDNGTAIINVDGSRFMSFEVEGIVVPSFLPAYFRGFQKNGPTAGLEQGSVINELSIRDVNCINYPQVVDEEFPYFLILLYAETLSSTDFDFYNCSLNIYNYYSGSNRFNVSVIDQSKPAYIAYQGFIVAVFNYTTG